jgi:hypothetical protein
MPFKLPYQVPYESGNRVVREQDKSFRPPTPVHLPYYIPEQNLSHCDDPNWEQQDRALEARRTANMMLANEVARFQFEEAVSYVKLNLRKIFMCPCAVQDVFGKRRLVHDSKMED